MQGRPERVDHAHAAGRIEAAVRRPAPDRRRVRTDDPQAIGSMPSSVQIRSPSALPLIAQ